MAESLEKTLKRINLQVQKKADEKAKSEQEDLKKTKSELVDRKRFSGKSGHAIKREARKILKEYADSAGIEQYDLFPGKEFPTNLTRLPLFPPKKITTARKDQAEITSKQDFVPLTSKWDKGGVWKQGPALTTYDAGTLIGILQMRDIGFQGDILKMPSKGLGGNEIMAGNPGKQVKVHSTFCVVSELESFVKGKPPPSKGWGGKVIRLRRESIERLAAQTLKFTYSKGLKDYVGKSFSMLEADWVGDNKDACYYLQIHPMMVSWLEQYKTYVDINIWRQLNPLGQAIYVFLASQKSNVYFDFDFLDVLDAIGWSGRAGDARRGALKQFEKLIQLEFMSGGAIIGNGRRHPFRLYVQLKEEPHLALLTADNNPNMDKQELEEANQKIHARKIRYSNYRRIIYGK